MTQTGDDKELVLGNKQLISLFFVVVALCGVFFAMGYMIGRNSAKATLAADSGSSSEANTAPPAVTSRQQPEPPRETASNAPESTTPAIDSNAAPAVDTRPAQDTAGTPPARPEPPPAEPKGVSSPETGASYLQVTALPQADADAVVKTLREQGFPCHSGRQFERWLVPCAGRTVPPDRATGRCQIAAEDYRVWQRFRAEAITPTMTPLVQIQPPRPRLPEWARKSSHAFRIAEQTEDRPARAQPAHGLRIRALPEYS